MEALGSYTYSGNPLTPEPKLSYNGKSLIKGTDYTLTYTDNINPGTASVAITGIGAFTDTLKITFTIKKAETQGNTGSGNNSNTNNTGNNNTRNTNGNSNNNNSNENNNGGNNSSNTNVNTGNTNSNTGNNNSNSNSNGSNNSNTNNTGSNNNSNTSSNNNNTSSNSSNIGGSNTNSSNNSTGSNTAVTLPSKATSSSVTINQSTGYISKLTSGINVASLLAVINEKPYCVIRKNGINILSEALVGTGMSLCVLNNASVKKTYTIIVTGDTNGDGKINITDMIAVKQSILGKSALSGIQRNAADVNGDGKVNITDFIKIKACILGKTKIVGISAQNK